MRVGPAGRTKQRRKARLGSVLNGWYRPHVAGALPAHLPSDLAHEAGQTLAGAVASSTSLPGPLGEQLLSVARTAYVDGRHAANLVGAAVLLCGALTAWRLLPRPPQNG